MMGDMYWRFLGALVLVVALIFTLAWVAKRLGFGGRVASARGKRRLGVQEVLSLDSKRRLVLLKRDGVEHLILLGLNDDVVVETGIIPPTEPPADPATRAAPKLNFANLLSGSRP
ncbi:MAG TPA: flagellar biosynthetic protein FliO [Stellaceae bacterium]|jgi:flagellar protein FliO/FliZ|nr:flagellar biosynthetic protein FliO [Stellaceae bacterium]